MVYKSVVLMAHNGLLWLFVELWLHSRRALFVSCLVAFSAQFVDSLLAANVSDLTYTEMMWFNLQHRSSNPMMFRPHLHRDDVVQPATQELDADDVPTSPTPR